jgi:FAD/FMN-containing dehydrogenase
MLWQNPEEDADNIAWRDQALELLKPFAHGHYVAESDIVSFPANAEKSYSPESWQRLKELRQKYDPEGVFFDYFENLS